MTTFVARLLACKNVEPEDKDPTHTVARLSQLIALDGSSASDSVRAHLEALIAYWGTSSDLAQRQEHGALKEGEELSVEDARRLLFHTALVMYEVDRWLG